MRLEDKDKEIEYFYCTPTSLYNTNLFMFQAASTSSFLVFIFYSFPACIEQLHSTSSGYLHSNVSFLPHLAFTDIHQKIYSYCALPLIKTLASMTKSVAVVLSQIYLHAFLCKL